MQYLGVLLCWGSDWELGWGISCKVLAGVGEVSTETSTTVTWVTMVRRMNCIMLWALYV